MEVDEDQRLRGLRPKLCETRPAVPGRDGGHLGVLPQNGDELRALEIELVRRTAQEDGEGRRVAEVLLEEAGRAVGLGARDAERGRLEAALHSQAENAEQQGDEAGDRQDDAGPSDRERRPARSSAADPPHIDSLSSPRTTALTAVPAV